MKNAICLFTIVYLLFMVACSKKNMDTKNHPAAGDDTDTTTGTTNSCSGNPSDILSMQIFASDFEVVQ